MKVSTRQLTQAAFLVAVSIILTRFAAVPIGDSIRLSFGNIPIYIAGLFYGAGLGGLVGAVADLAGYLINPYGAAFSPQIFLASVLRGVIPPLIAGMAGGDSRKWYYKVLAAITGTELVCGLFLTTWGLSWLFGTPVLALLPGRVVALVVQIPVYTISTYAATVKLRFYADALQTGKPN